MTDAGGSTASFYANDGNTATPFGALYQNCWLRNSDGNWFYANAGGDLAAGWFYQDGTWYYLDPATHIMQVGFVDLGSGKYYLDATGAMHHHWLDQANTNSPRFAASQFGVYRFFRNTKLQTTRLVASHLL